MTTTTEPTARASRVAGSRATQALGYVLVWIGGTVLLYLVWVLWFTGIETDRVQRELLDEFEGFEAAAPADAPAPDADSPATSASDDGASEVEIGSGVAIIEFERPGSDTPPVTDTPYVIVEGTTLDVLRDGPGRYVTAAMPGEQGNFAVAGHRTTNGAPFYDLDQIRPDDLVHVTTRDGTRHTYRVLDGSAGGGAPGQHIVSPAANWVLGEDPLGTGGAVLTLTTCHPRWSAAQRMVVFAELVDSVPA